MDQMDAKEFFIFLDKASEQEMRTFYNKSKNRIRKSVCAGWFYAKFNTCIEFEQPKLL